VIGPLLLAAAEKAAERIAPLGAGDFRLYAGGNRARDPSWIEACQTVESRRGGFKLIGSGYAQIIAPLVPGAW